jgi:hypothetical protein
MVVPESTVPQPRDTTGPRSLRTASEECLHEVNREAACIAVEENASEGAMAV